MDTCDYLYKHSYLILVGKYKSTILDYSIYLSFPKSGPPK